MLQESKRVREAKGEGMLPYIRSNVVNLFTILVGDNRSCSSTRISPQNHSILELDTNNCRSRRRMSRLCKPVLRQCKVPALVSPSSKELYLWWLSNLNPASG